MQDNFKTITDYPDYSVSDTGLIKNRHGKILKPRACARGYLRLELYRERAPCTVQVARIVLKTFRPHAHQDDLQTNHIDGDRQNNRLENLEWVTAAENSAHRERNGRAGWKPPSERFTSLEVAHIRSSSETARVLAAHYNRVYEVIVRVRCRKSYKDLP